MKYTSRSELRRICSQDGLKAAERIYDQDRKLARLEKAYGILKAAVNYYEDADKWRSALDLNKNFVEVFRLDGALFGNVAAQQALTKAEAILGGKDDA